METKFADKDCPLERAVDILGGKWKIKLLWIIHEYRTIRFNQLKRELPGITDLMLAKILKGLAADGIVKREQFNEIPPHVEYSLTESGVKLVESLSEIRRWVRENQPSNLQPSAPQVIPSSEVSAR